MKNNISNELMTRFHCGDVSAEEFKEVLLAAEQDSDLKEEIAIMASLADDLAELKADLSEEIPNSNAKIISIQPSYVPMMLKAAQNMNLRTGSVFRPAYIIIMKSLFFSLPM